MGRKEVLLQRFNEDTSGRNHSKGQRVLDNDLVSSISITEEESLICIDAVVISENLFNEYNSTIEIDGRNKSIISTYCTCKDFEKKEFSKKNYCCKHLVATFYKSLQEEKNNPLLNGFEEEKKSVNKEKDILDILLNENIDKEELKIEVYINRREWDNTISSEFKIGLNSMGSSKLYSLKDIDQFLTAYYNKFPIKYGKNFTFDIREEKLKVQDKRLISFIETLKSLDSLNNSFNRRERYVSGKSIRIPKHMVREFFQLISQHKVYLNEGFFYREVETEILYDKPPIDFDMKIIKGEYVLKSPNGMPQVLSEKNDVFLYGTTIYLPDYEFNYAIEPYIQVFNASKVITIDKEKEDTILRKLVPNLNLISEQLTLGKNIKDKILIDKVKFKFYFDKEKENVILTTKVKYGKYEFNIFSDIEEKIIYRDTKEEENVLTLLRALGFENIKDKFYLIYGDEYIFKFFKTDIQKLHDVGEVFYSENFTAIKSIGKKGISGEIKPGKFNYFEMEFKIGDISEKETFNILSAFRNNLKYYKLKTGEFLDLEEIELRKFLKLLDAVSPDSIEDNKLEIPSNKAIYVDNYLDENKMRYIKGKGEFKEIRDKFKKIESLSFEEPNNLKATLREYQKTGYNWFKTLDYLGFGGILGDEMGLGKTLQTITFILSNKDKKSLIVAPTSLIYNWHSEFEKFAPDLKVAISNGTKSEREELIRNVQEFDVIITTYNLMKRDLEEYKKVEFDYFIIDEAQNIKNPHSQNSLAVKEIKAARKFALTGTPIENSLMELWSIFDFVMPGYLYDEKSFSVRYHKKLNESPEVIDELNKLIKPFILRRLKKNVIKELPEKIEKKLIVPLNDEQKKVYATYAKHVNEIIEKKVKDDEFKKSKIEILSYITKLRQISLDPSVTIDEYSGGSGKIEALIELLHQSIDEKHKILVFSQFTSVLKNIANAIEGENISYSYLDGSISSEKRMKMVKEFNEGSNSVFLISLKAGGTGLNLTSADIVIHFDPWWNPAVEDQATDRAHRLGQKNVVEVIKLIAQGTIEEKIIKLQESKKELISKMLGDELSNADTLSTLTDEEILSLFSI